MSNTAKNPQDAVLTQKKAAKPRGGELSNDELGEVAGGKIKLQDISIVKSQDKSSPSMPM